MNNRAIQRIVVFGALAIIFVIASQAYWVIRTWNFNARDFDRSANMSLLNVAKELSILNQTVLPPQNLINRLSSNTYAVNINSQIDASTLDFYLRKNFQANTINEDFDYAVYDCHDEKMVYGKYVSYSPAADTTNIDKASFPQLANATYYFVVRFPKRTAYLMETMSVNIVFTIISLLTVLFFIYSMMIILRQKRLSELQKDFINNMTHEFKTPISTIKVAADVFISNPGIQGDSRLAKYASIIREQNNRLNTQVEKVLQITRIDRNTLELNKEIINMHELLDTILPSVQVKIEGQNGIMTQHLEAKQPYIKADALHLTNIIHNLLDNAMKYCKDNRPEVSVKTEDFNNNIRLTITDGGIGIDKEHHKKVFHRFYRVPTGNIHNVKGFGLGLYYVKNIVQAHGWQIDLASEVDNGTTITIDIPKLITTNTTSKAPKKVEEVI